MSNQMMSLEVHIEGDKCWPDLMGKKGQPAFIQGCFIGIARLPGGTVSGKSSVTVRIELPDGQVVLAETTLVLLANAVKAFCLAEVTKR